MKKVETKVQRCVPSVQAALLCSAFCAAVTISGSSNAETLSNRHQLSGCAQQSAPVVIPYATHRTAQLGLPADLSNGFSVRELSGGERTVQTRAFGDAQTLNGQIRHRIVVDQRNRAGAIHLSVTDVNRC